MDIESTTVVLDGKQWQKDLPELGDLELLVAPWENAAFERELQKLIRALPPALRADGNVEPVSYGRCLGRALARTILFDWRNFTSGGVAVAFEVKVAEQYLTDPKFRVLRDGVVAAAKRVQAGVKADEEAIVGNSPKSLPGNETGAQTLQS